MSLDRVDNEVDNKVDNEVDKITIPFQKRKTRPERVLRGDAVTEGEWGWNFLCRTALQELGSGCPREAGPLPWVSGKENVSFLQVCI